MKAVEPSDRKEFPFWRWRGSPCSGNAGTRLAVIKMDNVRIVLDTAASEAKLLSFARHGHLADKLQEGLRNRSPLRKPTDGSHGPPAAKEGRALSHTSLVTLSPLQHKCDWSSGVRQDRTCGRRSLPQS